MVHCDLDELTQTSIDGYKYTATFLDDATSFGYVALIKKKSDQFEAFKTFKNWAETQLDRKLKRIRTDRGTEFFNKKEKEYLREHGIEHESSMPYSQQQNRRAERFQQTYINKAESMRHHAGLSYGFWSFAVRLAVYVYNRTPLIRADYKTPFELWYRKQPDISHLRVFGCLAYVHVLKIKRKKLDPKSKEMIFVGYEPGSKGYQFWDAKNRRFEISRDVKFDESKFPNRKDLSAEDRKIKVKSTASPPSDTESENSDKDLVNPYPFSDGNDSDGDSHHQPKPPAGNKPKPTVEMDSDEDDDDDEQHHPPVQPVPPVQEQRGSQRHTDIPTDKSKGKQRDPGPSVPEIPRFTFKPPPNHPYNPRDIC